MIGAAISSASKWAEVLRGGSHVGMVGIQFRREETQPNPLPVQFNERLPAVFVEIRALEEFLSLGPTGAIGRILAFCRNSQIFPSVVRGIAVLMVQNRVWPFTSHVKPCQSTSRIKLFVDLKLIVSCGPVQIARLLPGFCAVVHGNKPEKFTTFWAIAHQTVQPFYGKHGDTLAYTSEAV